MISSATAEVLSMPYSNLDITPGTLLRHIADVSWTDLLFSGGRV